MNDRSTALLLIAVALAGDGIYIAGYVPAMLLGEPVPLLVPVTFTRLLRLGPSS